jgi:hypothetical protein
MVEGKGEFKWLIQNAINVLGERGMIKIQNRYWVVSGGGISTGVRVGRPISVPLRRTTGLKFWKNIK